MPEGIILKSGSIGASEEAIRAVLEKNGYEVDAPEEKTSAAVTEENGTETSEPQREKFADEQEFAEAHEAWQVAEEEKAAAAQSQTGSEEDEEDEQEAPRRPSRVQRKIERATRELREKLEKANERLAALERGGGGNGADAGRAAALRPERTAFASDAEYEDALLAWGVEKAIAERSAKEAANAQTEWLRQNAENYAVQVEEAKDQHEDWQEVMEKNKSLPIHEGVFLAIHEQENGAEVSYYLAKHPEYTKRLAEMSPISAIMEVGRLSTRLKTGAPAGGAANGGNPPKPRPRIPAPMQPVSSAASTAALGSKEAAEKRDYRAFKAAQRAGR